MIHLITSRQTIRADIGQVWEFFSKPHNLNLLTPPHLHFRILSGDDFPIYDGQLITYSIRLLPLIRVKWVTEIKNVVPRSSFIDEQLIGPYKFWRHHHQFVSLGQDVEVIDTVRYSIGFSIFGEIIHLLWIKHQLDFIFRFRKEKIKTLFGSQAQPLSSKSIGPIN